LKSALQRFVFERFFYVLILVLRWSYKISYVGLGELDAAKAAHPRGSVVLACWHEHLIGVLCTHRNLHTIVSRHAIGQVLGFVCGRFGYQVYFGSADRGQDKGGLKALLGLSRALRNGATACITVDGSIGPRRVAKKGVLEIANQSGAQIIPMAIAYDRAWEFRTWDRLKLPKPFARVVVSYGVPLPAQGRGAEIYEAQSLALGRAIDASEQQAQNNVC
jgi:lysophospholipid acyltransferase (LPLAT)-like uncharacterized protein